MSNTNIVRKEDIGLNLIVVAANNDDTLNVKLKLEGNSIGDLDCIQLKKSDEQEEQQ